MVPSQDIEPKLYINIWRIVYKITTYKVRLVIGFVFVAYH